MTPTALAVGLLLGASQPVSGPRLTREAPYPALGSVLLDSRLASYGLLRSFAKARGLEARILWVDATANMGFMNSEAKVEALVAKAKDAGFNCIVYDVKPIIGYTMYPSQLTKQLTSWRGNSFVPGYDPVKPLLAAAKRQGIRVYAALNAFSEGHRVIKDRGAEIKPEPNDAGWGYNHPDLQTMQAIPHPQVTLGRSASVKLSETPGGEAEEAAVHLTKPKAGVWSLFAAIDLAGRITQVGSQPLDVPAGGSVLAFKASAASRVEKFLAPGVKPEFGNGVTFSPISEKQTQLPLMMNPHDRRNWDRAFSFIKEVLDRYEVNGVIYDDRLRFGGINADFHPSTRQAFEKKVGKKLSWPDDVFTYPLNHRLNHDDQGRAFRSVRPGPYFDAWMAFRADTMTAFVKEAAALAHKSDRLFGVYAGSWYGDYAQYGSNYGSDSLSAGFGFMTPSYRRAGFASAIDFLITGCYYPVATMQEAVERGLPPGRSVEAGGILTNRVTRDQTWGYAGVMLADYARNPDKLAEVLQAASFTTQGVMVFDYSHDIDKFIPILKKAFKTPSRGIPHEHPQAVKNAMKTRAKWEKLGYKDAPFPILEGAPGAGF